MKFYFFLFLFLIGLQAKAQQSFSAFANIGLNRIGVIYEVGTRFELKKHNFDIGIRLYEPDLVFEKDFPGISLAYAFSPFLNLENKQKNTLFFGVGVDAFTELKGIYRLWLYNPRIFLRGSREISEHFTLNLNLNFGVVVNQLTGNLTPEQNIFTYKNYEASFGLSYRFGVTANN